MFKPFGGFFQNHRTLGFVTLVLGIFAFLGVMAWAEFHGLSRRWIGPIFLFSIVMGCAALGIVCRTTDPEEYYVAGRRIPPFFNGMAAAADWMSAASFISLAGALYLQGFSGSQGESGGLAYVLGWTGGFCLVALLIAPPLRRMNLYTVPDFFAVRFGGRWPRVIAALAAVVCSFTYVVAQIYGVGLIASRLTGVQFEIGIMLGLGGVLVCSFLGGMRAITWTQVAQYVVMFLTFLIPVSWLAYKQMGNPLAPLVYGQQLEKIAALEDQLIASPQEKEVQSIYRQRAQDLQRKLQNVEVALAQERQRLQERLREMRQSDVNVAQIVEVSRELANLPKDPISAREQWRKTIQEDLERAQPLGGMPRHTQAFQGDPDGSPTERSLYQHSRLNFLALMFCLMVGTAGLPHLLTRYYTSPSVADTRRSVVWSLFFIALVYLSAPALAVLVKFEVMNNLVGSRFDELPVWILQWAKVDPSLVSVSDVNGDGILQFGELKLGADLIMLAAPELGGLPYVVSGLVAAGGLAAALSTADGLLLTISNSLVRDLHFFERLRQNQSPEQRVIASKFVLMAVALLAAFVAALKPSQILPLVTASFSLAASALVPAMVLGIFWKGAQRAGAVAGMLAGLGVTLYYLLVNAVGGFTATDQRWWGIEPVCAGVFGVPAGLLVTVLVSAWVGRWPLRLKESPAIPHQI